MGDHATAERGVHQFEAEAVWHLAAIGQRGRRRGQRPVGLGDRPALLERVGPQLQIMRGGVDAAGADGIEVRNLVERLAAAVRADDEAPCARLDQRIVVRQAHARVRHAQRLEELPLQVLGVVHARDAANDLRKQDVAGVAVLEGRTGREQRRRLVLHQQRDRLVAAHRRGDLAPLEELRVQREDIGHARGVGEQLAQRDVGIGQLRQVLGGRVVQGQLAPLGQAQHGRGRELLADRANVEGILDRQRDLRAGVGLSQGALVDDLAVLRDQEAAIADPHGMAVLEIARDLGGPSGPRVGHAREHGQDRTGQCDNGQARHALSQLA